jgi:hypothetical protein
MLRSNARMGLVLGGLDRLSDLDATRARAADVRAGILSGDL